MPADDTHFVAWQPLVFLILQRNEVPFHLPCNPTIYRFLPLPLGTQNLHRLSFFSLVNVKCTGFISFNQLNRKNVGSDFSQSSKPKKCWFGFLSPFDPTPEMVDVSLSPITQKYIFPSTQPIFFFKHVHFSLLPKNTLLVALNLISKSQILFYNSNIYGNGYGQSFTLVKGITEFWNIVLWWTIFNSINWLLLLRFETHWCLHQGAWLTQFSIRFNHWLLNWKNVHVNKKSWFHFYQL